MPVTVRRLLAVPALGLRMLAGASGVNTPLLWVASSDLADPTPFLGPDQMLLTTGTQFGGARHDEYDEYEQYVGRLVANGVRALGFGTEVVRAGTPEHLVEACERHGLPLVEVPYRTPFIAIIRWSADVIADERHARDTWALKAQRAVARAALGQGGVVDALAALSGELGRTVILLDADGSVSGVHPAQDALPAVAAGSQSGAAATAGPATAELRAEARRLLHRGTRASSALTGPHSTVSLQTLGRSHELRGVLAVTGATELDRAEHSVITSVVALVEVSLEQSSALEAGRDSLNAELLGMLQDGSAASATAVRRVVANLGGALPDPPLLVLAIASADDHPGSPIERLGQYASQHFVAQFLVRRPGPAVLLLPADVAPDAVERMASTLGLSIGTAEAITFASLGRSIALATATQQGQTTTGSPGVRAADGPRLSGSEGLAGLIADPLFAEHAARVLLPLASHPDAAELAYCATVWLEHNGQWDPASRSLGLHRHSLRARVDLIERLLGTDLSGFAARAELWALLAAAPPR